MLQKKKELKPFYASIIKLPSGVRLRSSYGCNLEEMIQEATHLNFGIVAIEEVGGNGHPVWERTNQGEEQGNK